MVTLPYTRNVCSSGSVNLSGFHEPIKSVACIHHRRIRWPRGSAPARQRAMSRFVANTVRCAHARMRSCVYAFRKCLAAVLEGASWKLLGTKYSRLLSMRACGGAVSSTAEQCGDRLRMHARLGSGARKDYARREQANFKVAVDGHVALQECQGG